MVSETAKTGWDHQYHTIPVIPALNWHWYKCQDAETAILVLTNCTDLYQSISMYIGSIVPTVLANIEMFLIFRKVTVLICTINIRTILISYCSDGKPEQS